MRVLVAKYWTHFKKIIITKDGKKKLVKDGKKFEKLVKTILDLEYGENHWTETGETWDGSRDFEWKTHDYYRWAECKNYESNISLNVISNTLVMAMIDFADEILIFSYSKIKKPVLEKLIQFADVSQKILRIYADDSLEELILKYIEQLKDIFFPEFNLNSITSRAFLNPYISCNIVSDPVTAYTLNTDLGYIPQKPDTINFNSILCANIYIWNQTAEDIEISVKLDWGQCEGYFRMLSPIRDNCVHFKSISNSTFVKKIYFEPILYKSILNLPTMTISCSETSKSFSFGTVKCSWIGECSLQGASYKKVIKNFPAQILNSKFYRAINIYGTSGTGKSRLLRECENSALGYGYRVIKFSLNDLSKEDDDTLQKLVIEFICAIYDIPNLEEYMQVSDISALSDTFKMIITLKTTQIDQNYLKNEVSSIITQKLMNTKCYITFDNVQFYPKSFITFINDINKNLVLTNMHCKCRMGFSFNTDYIYQQSECIDFYSFLVKNKEKVKNIKCEGFSNNEETRVFLNQLLPNLEIDDVYVNKIINSSNRNPFYLQAYFRLLETEGILKQRQDCYVVPQHMYTIFKEKITNIPETIREIIKIRWNNFLSTNDETDSVRIIAVLHIFQHLNNEKIKKFLLSKKLLEQLLEHHFLKRVEEREIVYYFEHDLTEKFFSEEYFPLCQHAFEKNSLPPAWIEFWYSRLTDIVYGRNISLTMLKEMVQKNISHKIGFEIYTLLIDYLITRMKGIENVSEYLQIIVGSCANVREIYGTSAAIFLYEKIIGKIETDFPQYQSNVNWAWLMISYCNLLYENNCYVDAIKCIKDLLSYWPESGICNENITIYCYLYNRLHVYNRAMNIRVTSNSLSWLEKSEKIQKKDEDMFLNLIDRGYCNYDSLSSKKELVNFWRRACTIYENNYMPSKKMNYYYAKIRIHLFEGELEEARATIQKGMFAIETKEDGTYYFSYFKQRYLICEIALLLLTPTYKNLNMVADLINEAEDINYVLKGRTAFSIYWLKSIFLFEKGQYLDSFLCVQASIETLIESQKQTFQNIYLKQIYDNAEYFMAKSMIDCNFSIDLKILSNRKLISVLKKTIQKNVSDCVYLVQEHQATAVLQTLDHKINFPVL